VLEFVSYKDCVIDWQIFDILECRSGDEPHDTPSNTSAHFCRMEFCRRVLDVVGKLLKVAEAQ